MEQIEKLNSEIDEVEKNGNIKEKTEMIKNIKEKIKLEQEIVDKMIEKVNDNKSKKYKKFKGVGIDELIEMYHEEENLPNKIEIFQHLNYQIDSVKNQLFDQV